MQFSNITVLLSFAVLALTAPATVNQKRADVLTFRTYNQFQISNGTAGNALAEVNLAFPVCYLTPKQDFVQAYPKTYEKYRLTSPIQHLFPQTISLS